MLGLHVKLSCFARYDFARILSFKLLKKAHFRSDIAMAIFK